MPTLIGELEKITGSPSSVTQVMVRAHTTRITGSALTTDELVPIPVDRQGRFEVPLRPGKAILVLVHGGRVGEGERFPMLVEEGLGTITSAIKLASDRFDDYELDELERAAADMLASLDRGLVAATRAEVAKEDAEKARDKAGEHRDGAEKAAGTAAEDAATSAVQKADEKLSGYVTAAAGHAEDSKDSATSAGKDAGRAEAARQGAETIQQGLPDKIGQELETKLPGELDTRVPTELDKHLPGELDERVPPLVASSIADDRAVADAAAAAVEPLAQGAVDAAAEAIKWTKGAIPSDTDMNSWTAEGLHHAGYTSQVATLLNRPEWATGRTAVVQNLPGQAGGRVQVWWALPGATLPAAIGFRHERNGTWSAWEQLVTTRDLRLLEDQIPDIQPGITEAELPSGTDLDDFQDTAFRKIPWASRTATLANIPEAARPFPGYLVSQRNEPGGVAQWWIAFPGATRPPMIFIRHKSGTTWSDWAELGAGGTAVAPKVEAMGAGAARREFLVSEFWRHKGGTIGTDGKAVVALRFAHETRPFQEHILPKLEELGLPWGQALNSRLQGVGRNTMTWSEMQHAALNTGGEIMAHGATHESAETYDQLVDEIVTGKRELETAMPECPIHAWVQYGATGTFGGFAPFRTEDNFASLGGQILTAHHAIVSGQRPGKYLPLDGKIKLGHFHVTIEQMDVAGIQAVVNTTIDQGRGVILMMHPSYLELTDGITPAQLDEALEWIAAQRDAGRIEVVTPSGLHACDIDQAGRTPILTIPDFSQRSYGSALAANHGQAGPHELVIETTPGASVGVSIDSDVTDLNIERTVTVGPAGKAWVPFSVPLSATRIGVSLTGVTTGRAEVRAV